jgi:hypothetical protein
MVQLTKSRRKLLVRSYTTFKELPVWSVFHFAAEEEFPGMAKGPFQKASSRTYQYRSQSMHNHYGTMRVGSINAAVYTVEELVDK